MLENHFSAGDASLEEKERALYADAAPGDKNLLLHYPDGREADRLEQTPAGAPSTANGQGSESEASLSNTSAAESAPPGHAEGPGEEKEGPHAAGTLPPGGVKGPEEERPEFSSGEEPGQEEARVGVPTEGAASVEAEVQEGSSGVPEELQGLLGDGPMKEAVGTAESLATLFSPATEGEEAEGEGNTGSGHQSTELDGAQDAIPSGDESEAREGAEDKSQDHSLQSEDTAVPEPDHQPTDIHAVSDMASSGVEAEEGAEESKAEVDAESGEKATGQVSEMSKEGLAEASSEEEGGEEDGSEDEGVPSKEESGEDSGDGASSEEEGSTPGEAGELQKTPGATGHEEEGAQRDVEDLNTGSEGSKTQDTEAEASEERQQGRGNPVIAHWGRN